MTARGAYARRNAGHRRRRHQLSEQAVSDWDRLQVAFDGVRSAIRLLRRRRQPLGTPPGAHDTAADRLTRETAEYLTRLAGQIDRGEYDAQKPKKTETTA